MTSIDDVRDWTGTTPDDDTITATLTRHGGDVHLAATTILRRRRADMISDPSTFSVDGDYSQTRAEYQLKAIDAVLQRLGQITGDTTDEPSGLPLLTQTSIAGPTER